MADAATAIVVLAAGAGRRLGGVAKALLPVGGQPLLAYLLDSAAAVGVAPADVIVVVGAPFAAEVGAVAAVRGAAVVVNPAPARGMASSIACGFAALADAAPRVTGALLWPVDHGLVTPATLRLLLAAVDVPDAPPVIAPQLDGRGGHPVWIARRAWAALAACADVDGGARTVLRAWPRCTVAVADAAVRRDLDEPADLAWLAGVERSA